MRILVVDDELPIMQLCVTLLENQGHAAEGFTRGEALLARLKAEPADLLVVDYKMPIINGVEVVQRARSLRPGVRILMITGHGTHEVQEEARRAGVTGLLLKPFTPADLQEAVTAALEIPPSPAGQPV
jgi:CheY-like chemotaxis protein